MPEQFVQLCLVEGKHFQVARSPLRKGVRRHRPRGDGSNSQRNHAVLHGAELEHGSEREVRYGAAGPAPPEEPDTKIKRGNKTCSYRHHGAVGYGRWDIPPWGRHHPWRSAVNREPQLSTLRAVDPDYVYAIFPGQPDSRSGFVSIQGTQPSPAIWIACSNPKSKRNPLPLSCRTTVPGNRIELRVQTASPPCSGLEPLGLELLPDSRRCLDPLNTMRIPHGIEGDTVLYFPLRDHQIETGGGLGEFRSRARHNGLSGYKTLDSYVFALLSTLKAVLKANGHECPYDSSPAQGHDDLSALAGLAG